MDHRKISGWGRYPIADAEVFEPVNEEAVLEEITSGADTVVVPRGLGRSYGDSALAARVISTRHLDYLHSFDPENGVLTCGAGASLAELIAFSIPRGWFLSVTPGTRFVTVGGAVASDVHGKNHHLEGSFGKHVTTLEIATVSSGLVTCSPVENVDLFRASCGGMGLTGVITRVTLQLKPISSAFIDQTTQRAENLSEALAIFQDYRSATYSVAWIDCAARGGALGRSVVMTGEHSSSGSLQIPRESRVALPFDMPGFLLNRHSISAFNHLYYAMAGLRNGRRDVPLQSFFYPLDAIGQWNKLYGSRGFTQYQLVLPREGGVDGIHRILERVSESGHGSFLAVLKVLGPAGSGLLSFPMEGYTLALDFKLAPGLFDFLDELDQLVLDFGGRLYLAKDARMSDAVFKLSYPQWEAFADVRARYGADQRFHSLQSRRLGI